MVCALHVLYLNLTLQLEINCICCCLVAKLCSALCDPMDCSLPGSSCPWNFPGKNTRVVATSFSKGSSQSRDKNTSPALADRFFTTESPEKLSIWRPEFYFTHLGGLVPMSLESSRNQGTWNGEHFTFFSLNAADSWSVAGG